MRLIATLFLFAPIFASAQEIECKVKKTTDPYTKEAKVSSGAIKLDGATLTIHADSKEIDFFFTMDAKEKCFNDQSTAVVLYESKNRLKANFRNAGTMNCDGFFHFIFRNTVSTPSLLQKLITQKIISIQFTDTNKGQIMLNLSPEQQDAIISKADCLMKEAKKLIK
jgi:hypothetical protein